jgi:hypothetical protein
MNPLVKKEIRLLLPAWIAAMLLAIAPIWIFGSPGLNYYASFAWVPDSCFAFGAILLGIASFGQEFSSGTFAMLLSQPTERRRLWSVKILVLAGAFIFVSLAFLVSRRVHFDLYDFAYYQRRPLARLAPVMSWSNLGSLALYAAACFSGGLWTTLLLRRMSEAFWVTLLIPPAILIAVGALLGEFTVSDKIITGATTIVLVLYSIAGFFWARRLFLHAQDIQWTGGIVGLPSRRRIAEQTANRLRHWFAALVWKELQLHQVNILIAGVVLVLHLASIVIRKFHPHFTDPNIGGFLELTWVLWLLMPLLIGSAAVAEEHRVGVIESQLCLPVSRRAQFVIKFFIALILSLFLGGVLPFAIERAIDLGRWIFVVAATIFFISFYASTVARSTLQAMGLAIVLAVVIYFYEVATAVSVFAMGRYLPNKPIGIELLKLYLGIPILVLTLGGLMYWNFKWLHAEGKLRWRNGITFLGTLAFIFICTNSIYFRAWEFLTPAEPSHGPARLHDSKKVKFAANLNTIYAVLPDCRLRVETLAYDRQTFPHVPKQNKSEFIGGSNWVAVAADDFQAIGIQSDGSLWSLQRRWNPAQPHWLQTGSFELSRIGQETNWWQAVGGSVGFLLLKKDGSLWVWGANGYDWHNSSNSIPQEYAQYGQQTDWTELYSSGIMYAKKRDGSIWDAWPGGMVQNTDLDSLWPNFVSSGVDMWFGIKTNGELWFFQAMAPGKMPSGMIVRRVQLGQNAKWKVVTLGGWPSIEAIRSDGTLWNWSDYWPNVLNTKNRIEPTRLGNYSNWIAFPSTQNRGFGATVLAADGSIWIWNEPSGHVWLAPSRKPVYLGNIFTAQ